MLNELWKMFKKFQSQKLIGIPVKIRPKISRIWKCRKYLFLDNLNFFLFMFYFVALKLEQGFQLFNPKYSIISYEN